MQIYIIILKWRYFFCLSPYGLAIRYCSPPFSGLVFSLGIYL